MLHPMDESVDSSSRVRDHLRSNVVGYVALFLALNAGAYAVSDRNPQIRGDTTELQSRVNGKCAAGEAIRIVQRKGTVVCQTTSGKLLQARRVAI